MRAGAAGRVSVVVPNAFPGLPVYRLPAGVDTPAPGSRVVVPFGSRVLTGVAGFGEPEPLRDGGEREVLAVLDEEPFLPGPLLAVLLRGAAYYFVPPGELLRAAVPGRLLSLGQAVYLPSRQIVGRSPDDPKAARVLSAIVARGKGKLADLAADLGAAGLPTAIRRLLDEGFVRLASESVRPRSSPVDRAWIARAHPDAESILARRPGQAALYRHLLALSRPAAVAELRAAGVSTSLLPALQKAGLACFVEEERRADLALHAGTAGRDASPIVPTPAQAAATEAIASAVRAAEERAFLLDGVTGSGKTEVYLSAAEAARREGKQSILLVPEIALAPALVRRVLARFGDRVSLLHSGLSDGERASEWERARRGDVDTVVGPRSAVFAPLPNLGLIVVDEAHEGAYKQNESPRYDARTIARARAREERLTLVFGSATPAMEQERGAREGRLPRLVLPARPGTRLPAAVEVVDLRREAARPGDHGRVLFATRTVEILRSAFDRGEQGIVLLNRRGFSPTLLCRSCGGDFRCTRCSVARTYHRRGEHLLCHYCGERIPRPETCPECGSDALMPIGFGTERLAERFVELFPGVRHSLLDRDAAARRGGAAGILIDFEEGRSQALLGTQMVAKGHDFPGATAVAVLDADALLSFPDFRSAERTFQLVTQAAGRVGRGEKAGLVAVQTSRPEHPAIAAAVRQDPAAFADAELRFRRTFRYPPYAHLLLALWTDRDASAAFRAAAAGGAALTVSDAAAGIKILGPAPAPLERLKGLYRVQLLVRSDSREAIAAAGALLAALDEPPRLDVDPQSLM